MATWGKTIRTGMAAVFLLVGLTTGAKGFIAGGGDPFGFGPGGSLGIQLKGNIVCAQCTLAEVRQTAANPYSNHRYQLTHRLGQVVLDVTWVSNPTRWNHLTVPRLRVRGEDRLFEQLMAEENLFKQVEISGLLNLAQVFDISSVTIRG